MIELLFGGAVLVAMVLMVWESEQMIQEKKRRAKEKSDLKGEEISMLLGIKEEDILRVSEGLAKSNLRGKIDGYVTKVDYPEDKIGVTNND